MQEKSAIIDDFYLLFVKNFELSCHGHDILVLCGFRRYYKVVPELEACANLSHECARAIKPAAFQVR
jgi:hypothetical protein